MMKKAMLLILAAIVISIVACQQQPKAAKTTAMPAPNVASEAAVDAIGKDLGNVAADQNDLSTDNLSDLDSGLSAVQNI